jgi:catechol 1,2-dioxygenase
VQLNQTELNLRGKFLTDAEGRCSHHQTLYYPTGWAGRPDVESGGRHPYCPAHIHFIVSGDGYEAITTEIFVEGDPI